MSGRGRPLWFFGTVVSGWAAARVIVALPIGAPLPPAIGRPTAPPLPASATKPLTPRAPFAPPIAITRLHEQSRSEHTIRIALQHPTTAASDAPPPLPPAPPEFRQPIAIAAATTAAPVASAMTAAPSRAPALARLTHNPALSVSSWLIVRSGTGLGAGADAPQLGGSQGGVRVDYRIAGTLAVTGRLAAPAAGARREASIGIAWRPPGMPLRFVAERRIALDGGRGGPAIGVSGGVAARPVAAGFTLDGYAQAGAIARFGIEHYVDGSARVARPAARLGAATLDIGGGIWGGAQRGVARLDIGPSVAARLPVAGRAVRLALDWRQRVAGAARPGSGPALSLGSDF